MVGHRDPQHRGKNDRRVAEHHGENEPDESACTAASYAPVPGAIHPRRPRAAAHREPDVAREQARGDVAREPLRTHRPARDVLSPSHSRQRDQTGAETCAPQVDRRAGAGDDGADDRHEQRLRHPRTRQETRQFEPLAGDRQDEKGRPPRRDAVHRDRRPHEVAHDQHAAPSASVNVNSADWRRKTSIDAASNTPLPARNNQAAMAAAPMIALASGPRKERRGVRPEAADSHGAFERDDDAEKPADHERSVQRRHRGGRGGDGPAEPREARARADEKAGKAENQQWHAVQRL